MAGGDYRHRITVQQFASSSDGAGGRTLTPSTHSQPYAAIEALTGHEKVRAAKINASVDYRIRIRWPSSVSPRMEVVWNSRRFIIHWLENVHERNREIHLMCEQREQ